MALAASQFDIIEEAYLGPNMKCVVGTFTGPASYTSGGEALSLTIAKTALGLSEIHMLDFTPLVDENNAALMYNLVFDHTRTTTTHGKIRAVATGLPAHTHDLLIIGGQSAAAHTHDLRIIGGQGAAGTDTVQAAVGDLILGKEEAVDALIAGADEATKGGVVAGSTPTGLLMVGTDTLGKEQATNRTIAGADSATKGGVVAAAAVLTAAEVTAATNLSGYVARFVAYGV